VLRVSYKQVGGDGPPLLALGVCMLHQVTWCAPLAAIDSHVAGDVMAAGAGHARSAQAAGGEDSIVLGPLSDAYLIV
jgi:hypothetical protein